MALHTSRKGLRLPITGEPSNEIERARAPRRVALLASDYIGLRPTMHVSAGDDVRRGDLLFEDKKRPGVRFTSPAAGTVTAVNRGERRALQSVVIELSREEREGREPAEMRFRAFSGRHPSGMTGDEVRDLLVESGAWTALRERPFGRVADPEARPHSIFVTAMTSDPLAPPIEAMVAGNESAFERGLAAVGRLTDGPVFVCTAPGSACRVPTTEQIRHEEFRGPHPAGTVGFHIHTLDPVDGGKTVWHLSYQDVVMVGRLFETGGLDVSRLIAIGGPPVRRPRLLLTRIGASLDDLVTDELGQTDEGDPRHDEECRLISGSVFSGRASRGDIHGYLGRYHQQISVLREDRTREFMGWLGPGFGTFSTIRTFVSAWLPGRRFAFTTTTHGSPRAIVPIGMFEKVMPLDLMPTALMRALAMEDVERAEELGCLELDEEDVALCTFVCPGKNDYGPHLRHVLDELEKEG
jgi:Na+-transporting NADH:ubiquinone oxidoreductase subunit A